MATTFQAGHHHPLLLAQAKPDVAMNSPTTPRPNPASQQHPPPPPPPPSVANVATDDATTPTRSTFAGNALASQLPLPTTPFPPQTVQRSDGSPSTTTPSDLQQQLQDQQDVPQRENSQHSRKSRESEDVDMDDSDGEGGDDGGGSDDESVNADGTRSGKKRKSQRFYCTDYPPCNLSFTRSEHLARHIRYERSLLVGFFSSMES